VRYSSLIDFARVAVELGFHPEESRCINHVMVSNLNEDVLYTPEEYKFTLQNTSANLLDSHKY
jgi:hypothetical protein